MPDISKAINEIGYFPEVTLEKGIEDFFGWADKVYKGIEH